MNIVHGFVSITHNIATKRHIDSVCLWDLHGNIFQSSTTSFLNTCIKYSSNELCRMWHARGAAWLFFVNTVGCCTTEASWRQQQMRRRTWLYIMFSEPCIDSWTSFGKLRNRFSSAIGTVFALTTPYHSNIRDHTTLICYRLETQ